MQKFWRWLIVSGAVQVWLGWWSAEQSPPEVSRSCEVFKGWAKRLYSYSVVPCPSVPSFLVPGEIVDGTYLPVEQAKRNCSILRVLLTHYISFWFFFLIPPLLYFNSTLHLTPYFSFHFIFLSLFALLSAFLFYLPPLFSPTNLALTIPSLLCRRRVFPILDVSTAVGPEDR